SMDWGDVKPRAQADLQRATAAAGGQADAERQQRESEAYAKLQAEEQAVSGQADARHDAMLKTAWDRYLAHDFEGAIRLAQAVLDEDKTNPGAQETLDAARDAQRQTRSEKFLRDRAESWARWHESMEAVRVPTDE